MVLVGGIHVLRANGAAVSFTQCVDELAQRHTFFTEESVANVEHGLLIRIGKPVKRWLQLRDHRTLLALERIQVGPAGTNVAVSGDELLHGCALACQIRVGTGSYNDFGDALLSALSKSVNNGHVRHVARIRAIYSRNVLQRIEVLAPRIWHAPGISEIVFIHLFNVRCIAAKEIGVALVGLIDRRGLAHVSLASASLREAWVG